jgi:hypothetical protein
VIANRLENIKRDEIRYFSNYKWLPNWEKFLTSDYWKSWQAKISTFQTEKELDFYAQRIGELADFIHRCKKYGVRGGENADLLIHKEELRLQNISLEDWKKEYKFSDVKFEEMSTEEITKTFGKDIEVIIKGEVSEKLNKSENYDNWSDEKELIKEIEKLNSLKNSLKNGNNLTQSQIANRNLISQKLDRQLNNAEAMLNKLQNSNVDTNNSNLSFLTIVGVVSLFALLVWLIIHKRKRK